MGSPSVMPTGTSSPVVTRSSTPEPSRFAREILSLPSSLQYIFPAMRSRVIPSGPDNPELTRSSTTVPSRLERWILLATVSAQ